jgi:tetratricopeptide (TPR) repeat protein
VTHLPRLYARLVLPALAALALSAPVMAATTVAVEAPSGVGSYLAGQQALNDLSTADAAKYFHDALADQWNNPSVVTRALSAYLANGDIDRAIATANHLLDLDPNNILGKLTVATADLKDRRYRAAIAELDKLPVDNFPGITGAILRAWAYVGDGRRADGFASLDKISTPGLSDFLVFHRALMADVAGDSADAVTLAGKAYDANSNSGRTVEAYARILGNAGRFDDGIAVADKFAAQGYADPLIQLVKKSLVAHQRPGLFAANVQSGAAEMFRGVSLIFARDGSNALAVGFLQLGLYLDPHNDGVALLLGQMFDDAGQHKQANDIYAGLGTSSPLRLAASVRVAQNVNSMGNRPEAITQLGNIVRSNPDNLEALSILAQLLRFDSQYDASATIYTQALSLDDGNRPADWALYYQRGIAYERGGKWDKAQPDFLKALDLNPDQPDVLNYLGYTWVDKGQNLTQALDMIQKAVKAQPTDGFIVDSLGWAFFKLGRVDDAVSTLEQAVQLKPNDPAINDHLGDAYWKAGRKLEAHFQWNVAASLDTDGSLKASIAKKQVSGLDSASTAPAAATVTQ